MSIELTLCLEEVARYLSFRGIGKQVAKILARDSVLKDAFLDFVLGNFWVTLGF